MDKFFSPFGRKRPDLTGNIYGEIEVIGFHGKIKGIQYWNCKCSCGNTFKAQYAGLVALTIKHCGCLTGENHAKHHLAKSREYITWVAIKSRCYNPKAKGYKRYGGRGITVCDRWVNDFDNFYKDMGPKPSPVHSLDRFPNVNGNYEPTNCRWATSYQQAEEKTSNRYLFYGVEKHHFARWAELLGVKTWHIQADAKRGFSVEEIIKSRGLSYVKKEAIFVPFSFGHIN